MDMTLMIPMIILTCVCIAGLFLVVLHNYAPTIQNIIEGDRFATEQSINHVQCNNTQTLFSDNKETKDLLSQLSNLQEKYNSSIQGLNTVKKELEEKTNALNSCKEEVDQVKKMFVSKEEDYKKLQGRYNEIIGKLFPVSPKFVADIFCHEFEEITSCIGKAERTLYTLLGEETEEQEYYILLNYLKAKQHHDIHEFYGWYLTLKYASSLTGVAAVDIDAYPNHKAQLSYLRRNAFLRYYRPVASALILCIEKYRNRSKKQQAWTECLSQLIEDLAKQKVIVNYIRTGAEYDNSSTENIIITESTSKNMPLGVVEDIVSIGINSLELDVPIQETEIIMNL